MYIKSRKYKDLCMVDIIYIFRYLYYAHAQTTRKHARCSYCACRAYLLWHSSIPAL